jgi:protein-disulfide isomerase
MIDVLRRAAASGALALLLGAPAAADDPNADLRREVEAIRQTQTDILKQLEEIKRLLQARPSAPAAAQPRPEVPNVSGVVFDLGTNPIRGAKDAGLTLIEFSDYQ